MRRRQVLKWSGVAASVPSVAGCVLAPGDGKEGDATPSGGPESTPRDTAEAADETATESPTETSGRPAVAFSDDFEDGNLQTPAWKTEGDTAVELAGHPGEGGHVLSLSGVGSGNTTAHPRGEFRLGNDVELEGMFRILPGELADEPFEYGISLGRSERGAGVVVNIAGPRNGDETVNAWYEGRSNDSGEYNYLIDSSTGDVTLPWGRETWYRYRISHRGDGEYPLKMWVVSEPEPEMPDQVGTGTPVEESGYDEDGFTLQKGYSGPSGTATTIDHAYVTLRTDG